MTRVAIIGGGLAGLSLATELIDENYDVIILEKNKYLGGRASNTLDKKMKDPVPIGPHVFVSGYYNLQRFFKKIGVEKNILWDNKIFLDIYYKDIHELFKTSKTPLSFYIFSWMISDKILSWPEKLSNLNLIRKLFLLSFEEINKLDDTSAYTFLKNNGVKDGAIEKWWRFFVISLLNVPLEICSATEFLKLLRIWMRLKNRKFGFSKFGLGDIYTKNAEMYIGKENISLDAEVKKIAIKNKKVEYLLLKNGKKIRADIYVSTSTPVDLRKLLPRNIFKELSNFVGVPYISVNLWFDRKITNKKFWALVESRLNTDFYDLSNIYSGNRNYSFITSNIIYSKRHSKLTDEEIIKETFEEIKRVIPNFDAKLKHWDVHRIPYVIYAPKVGMRKYRMADRSGITNLYIAGDWTVQNLPQCMESAVKSGYLCAEGILNKKICDDTII